ncbi:MAG: hypothetical protein WCD76_17905 [Pyrinomonadaceae bacterium]
MFKRFYVPILFAVMLLSALCAPLAIVPVSADIDRTFVWQGTTKPAACSNKTLLLHLTQTDGANAPGLYRCNGTAYVPVGGSSTVTGTGTTNKVVKWSNGAGGVLADSIISDDGTTASVGGVGLVLGRVASVSLNANSAVFQTVFTAPTGKTFVPVRLVYRAPTVNLSAVNFRCQNSGTTSVLMSGTMPTLTTAAKYGVQAFDASDASMQDLEVIAAGASLQCKPVVAFGSAATVTADAFGYLF